MKNTRKSAAIWLAMTLAISTAFGNTVWGEIRPVPQTKILSWSWSDPEENLLDGRLELTGITEEAQPSFTEITEYLPQAIIAQVGDGEDWEEENLQITNWTCTEYVQDEEGRWPLEGTYEFKAELEEGYELAEGVDALVVEVSVVGDQAVMVASPQLVMSVMINGEQKDYKKDVDEEALIVVNADIELYKDIPSFTAPIEVVVENVGQEAKTFNVQINGNAKTGVFTYSNVEGYKDGENTESLGTEVKDISLPTKDTAKTIKREVTVVNNNNFDVQDAKVEGTISNTNDSKEVKLSYAKGIQELNNQETVEYSYEKSGENWTTNVEDYSKVQRFRINMGTMTAGQTSKFEYEVNVQEQQDGGLQGYMQDTVNYSINEQTLSETNKTTVSTPQIASVENEATKNDNISTVVTPKETQDQTKDENKTDSTDKSTNDGKTTDNNKTEQVEPLTVEYVAKKADKAIKDGDEVFEGEVISYHVKITNNTKTREKLLILTK